MHGKKNRGIGVFVRFRELSSFRNTKTRDCHTFPRKLDFSHAISHALKAFNSPFSLTVLLSLRALSRKFMSQAPAAVADCAVPDGSGSFLFYLYFSIFLRRASVASSSFCSSDFSAFKVETFLYLFAKVSSSRSGIVPISHIVLNWPPTACCNF